VKSAAAFFMDWFSVTQYTSFLGSTAQLRPWPPPQNPAEILGGFSTITQYNIRTLLLLYLLNSCGTTAWIFVRMASFNERNGPPSSFSCLISVPFQETKRKTDSFNKYT
jgi:hypothetical protein